MNSDFSECKAFLSSLSASLIKGCRVKADDGTVLFTPDGISSYNALWLRDFSYMVEYAGSNLSNTEIINCIRYAISHRREDGWFPDRIYADGTAVYAAGATNEPVGEANLDNTPFLIFIVHSLMLRMDHAEFHTLFAKWEPALCQGLAVIPRSASGLVYNDPHRPHSPYGFTDTVCKTGDLYMESLLYWRACLFLSQMTADTATKEKYTAQCAVIQSAIYSLYHAEEHYFVAALGACSQIDIWGMAYMIYIDFPLHAGVEQEILHFLEDHYSEYTFQGQIRHLPKGQYWERLLIPVAHEEYQNGAYWATASGWIIWCLFKVNPSLAAETLYDAVQYLKEKGSFECVNTDYQKLPSFVVSAANIYGCIQRISNHTTFIDSYNMITGERKEEKI